MSDTPISDLVEQLLSYDCPPDKLLEALRKMERAIYAATTSSMEDLGRLNRKREWDKNYRRQKRSATLTLSYDSRTTELDQHIYNTTLSSLSTKEEKKEEEAVPVCRTMSYDIGPKRPKRKMGHSLPDDWRPKEKHYDAGRFIGLNREAVDREAENMRLWAQANQHRAVARKSDWDATFLGWVRRLTPKPSAASRSNFVSV